MAGFSKAYFIGGHGGFMGSDGVNPFLFEVLVGDASRQWLEVFYFDKNIKPLGNISRFVPSAPNDPNSILDACIIFFPEFFKECSSMPLIKTALEKVDLMDFDLDKNIPEEWHRLRKEAKSQINKLAIYEANLIEIKLDDF